MVKLIQYDYIMRSEVFSTNAFIQICNFSMNAVLFRRFTCRPAAFLAIWGRQEKSATDFCRLRFGGWELFYELFTKSLLLEMTHENLIRRLQGFVILAVSGAKPLHCGNEYIVIAALPLELL
jgi:hypothetical protein